MFERRNPRLPAVAVLAIFATACADQVTAPTSDLPADLTPLLTAEGSTGKPAFIANSNAYRNTSSPNATGRAGSATIVARALLGKDGATLLEVTTGALDSDAAAPGNIDKTQVKAIIDPELDPLYTKNFNGLRAGGYFAESFDAMARGTIAQVQANISGIDRNRTGVVTLRETVKLRPDLTASVSAPADAYVDTDVHVSATISEINGDVGATASCVLYADGAERDRANGIWVNNGSSVTCAFTTSFATTGTKTLVVAAESVVPGDWDLGNNADTTSIEIVDQTTTLHGWAYAHDHEFEHEWAWTYSGSFPNFDHASKGEGRSQGYWIYGYNQKSYSFPVNISVDEKSDGVTVASFAATAVGENWYGCAYVYEDGHYFYACPEWGFYHYGRYAGDVTYWSSNFAHWTGSSIEVYSWNYTGRYTVGAFAEWQDDVNPTLTIESGGERLVADPKIPLQPQSGSWAWSDCWYYDYYYSNHCYAYEHRYSGKFGWDSF